MSNAQAAAKPLLLRPKVSRLAREVIQDSTFVGDIVRACGSPANLLFPNAIAANVDAYTKVFADHGLNGKIYFAHKANQSHSMMRQLALTSVNADVASLEELRHALGSGFDGSRLESTGPKNAEFLYLCLMHGVTISVDSMQELADIRTIRTSLGLKSKAQVLLRLCGFKAGHSEVLSKSSRFGINQSDLIGAFAQLAVCTAEIEFKGFAFHLDSISLDERLVAIEQCLVAFEQAMNAGLEPRVINIGGGFRINYLEHESDWNDYTSAIRQAALGTGAELTWHNNFFGLSAQNGVLHGKLNSYGYYEPKPGAAFLEELLSSELVGYGNQQVASVLRDNMIELWLEPGRSLLDQCGITVARVSGTKLTSDGQQLVLLNMKRQDIAFLDQEVFVDPILVGTPRTAADCGVYFAGNLCLEADLIFRHKVFMPGLPTRGDLLAFCNTAAYMMDFSATKSIMQPPAQRVAVVQRNNKLHWMLDEQYTPIWYHHERE